MNTPLDRLTDRQRQVVALVADGRTNGEIADALGITERTVKYHVRRSADMLGATCSVPRAWLAARYLVWTGQTPPLVLPADVLARFRALADALEERRAA